MKRSILKPILIATLISVTFISCKKEGCTNPSATNYDSSAEQDDGSCVMPTSSNSNNTNNNIIDETPQYSFDLDGTNYAEESAIDIFAGTSSDKEISQTSTSAIWSSFFFNDPLNYTVIDVLKGIQTYGNGTLTDNDFADYFAPGNYTYADLSEEGVAVQIGLPNGTYYDSKYGPQSGSSFEIISIKKEYSGFDLYVKVHVEFSCKVYNINDPSDVKTITNGVFVNHFTE